MNKETQPTDPELINRQEQEKKDPAQEVEFVIPENVKDTFNQPTQKTVDSMQPESRRFFSKLVEKFKSTDMYKNYSDAKEAKKFDKLSRRKDKKIENISTQKKSARKDVSQHEERAKKHRQEMEKTKAILEKMKKEIDPDTLTVIEAKINHELEKAEEAEARAQLLQGEIENIKAQSSEYKAKAEQARDRIIGRFNAKIEQDSRTIQDLEGQRDNLGQALKNMQEKISQNDDYSQQLQEQLDNGIGVAELAAEIKKNIKELARTKKQAAREAKSIQKAQSKLNDKIQGYKNHRQDLQNERDMTVPPRKEAGQQKQEADGKRGEESPQEQDPAAEQSPETPQPIEYNRPQMEEYTVDGDTLIIETDKNETIEIDDGGIDYTDGEGNNKKYSFDNVPKDIIQEVKNMHLKHPEDIGAHESVIEFIKSLQETEEGQESKKYTAADLIYGWNNYISNQLKEKGYKITINQDINLAEKIKDFDQARIYLKRVISKKLTGRADGRLKLARQAHQDIENFLVQKDFEQGVEE